MPGRPSRPKSDLPPVGQVLRKIRGELTVAEAGAKVGHAHTWWHAREIGALRLTAEDMQAIALAFRVTWRITAKTVSAH